MNKNTNNSSADASSNSQKLKETTICKHVATTLFKYGIWSAEIQDQDRFRNSSDGQIKRDLAEQHHQLCNQVQVVQVSGHIILFYHCDTWTLLADCEKRIQTFDTECQTKLLRISYTWNTSPTTGCGTRSVSLSAHWNLFWQMPRDGNSHDSDMSRVTITSPQPSFRSFGKWATPWSTVEMLDGQCQRMDIPDHVRTAHGGLPQKGLEEDLCWIVSHVPRRPEQSKD